MITCACIKKAFVKNESEKVTEAKVTQNPLVMRVPFPKSPFQEVVAKK
jgi:hypothetical protein